jgi:esterase/lipase superfamily enzyme
MSLDFLADPQKHIILRKAGVLDKRRFFKLIGERLTAGRRRDAQGGEVLVFIHGFNVRFEKAARRTAQIAYDLDFKGVPVFFSWPSNGALYAYVSDREDVEWSVPHIAGFLSDVARSSGGDRIHVIAHSMGHEGLLRALNQLALQAGRDREPLFDNVIMAAPDFDAEIFADQLAPRIGFLSKHWTLYASDKDVALNVSSGLRSAARLGLPLTVVEDVVTVDATGVDVTPWSVPEFHSYYATKQRVIADIVSVLKGVDPTRRQLRRTLRGRLPYWRLSGLE